MKISDSDKELLSLLSANSRAPISELAKTLGLSRATVKDRIEKLQRNGVIHGFTIRYSEDYEDSQLYAHVMIETNPKKAASISRALQKLPEVSALHAVNGVYDMIAMIRSESARSLDRTLDHIGALDGIERTVSSIILSTKFDR